MANEQASSVGQPAWLGPRLVALFIDWLIFSFVWMLAGSYSLNAFVPAAMPIPPKPGEFPVEISAMMGQMAWLMTALFAVAFLYFVIAETVAGATIGKKLVKIRTVRVTNPTAYGLPFAKALLREAVKFAGFFPALVVQAYVVLTLSRATDASAIQTAMMPSGLWFAMQMIAQFLPLIWLAYIGVSLVTSKDPIYDRVVGTTVVRV